MTTSKNSDARFIKFIRDGNPINPVERGTDISWVQFIGALLLIPVFVAAGVFFLLADKLGRKSPGGVNR